jgi:hypothetical protein
MKNGMFSQNIQSFQKNLVKERSNLAAPPWAFVISVFNAQPIQVPQRPDRRLLCLLL